MMTANALPATSSRRHGAASPRALARGARHLGARLRRLGGLAQHRRRRLLSPVWAAAVAGVLSLVACAPAEATQDVVAAAPVAREDLSPRAACLDAAREAEREHGLPEGLLVGIALNESGLHAHALNIGGRAYYPDSKAEAMRLIRAAGGRAMVGCMQVNAAVHARGGQDWPLDPYKATEWAANYLLQHYETYGDWSMALVRWHGGSAEHDQPPGLPRAQQDRRRRAGQQPVLRTLPRHRGLRWRRSGAMARRLLELAEAAD